MFKHGDIVKVVLYVQVDGDISKEDLKNHILSIEDPPQQVIMNAHIELMWLDNDKAA